MGMVFLITFMAWMSDNKCDRVYSRNGAVLLRKIIIFVVLCSAWVKADTFHVDGVEFVYRMPASIKNEKAQQIPVSARRDAVVLPRVMVLFGGRGWQGEKTLAAYTFDRLADKHGLILLSPSFSKGDYWEPEHGSGETLKKAIAEVLRRASLMRNEKLENRNEKAPPIPHSSFLIPDCNLYLYGYSAGGQCANLFYAWMPGEVAAWGAHGCGVYNTEKIKGMAGRQLAPALITCGIEDAERHAISRQFAYTYREMGGGLLWKPYPGSGHELTRDALALAEAWFDAVISDTPPCFVGEDDILRVFSADKSDMVDVEFRNPIANETIREQWQAVTGVIE